LDWPNGDAGKALSQAVDRFMRYEDMRETLLILLYSGGSWIRENTGKLELWPRWHIIPGIDWMDLVGDKLLATSSDLVLLFDLPTPTPADLPVKDFWTGLNSRFELVRPGPQEFQMHFVAFSGCGLRLLMDRLKSVEPQASRNISIAEIYFFASQPSSVDVFTFKPEAISPDATLAVFKDVNPRLQYVLLEDYRIFQDAEVIHEEGYCKVLQIAVDGNCSFPRERVRQVSK
jgi:hypothetical protein